ncbi:hypothetical protein JW711_05080 [Candidatus Woesearchaeota archaeon]|nr:hypothetical protein [Candidatus Woesearchaeota archaeon]
MSLEGRIYRERLMKEAKLGVQLEKKLSCAIAGVLKEYGISGPYMFNVYRDENYCQKPIYKIKNKTLSIPQWCLGSGSSQVDDPARITPI